MADRNLCSAGEREDGGLNEAAREEGRPERGGRRRAFWTDLSETLLSMPAAIGVRLGG